MRSAVFFELLLSLGIGFEVSGPWVEAGVAEAVEEKVDRGLGVGHAELARDDGSDLGPAQGADAVLGLRTGVDPLAKLFDLEVGQERGTSGLGTVGQAVGRVGIVASDPVLNGPTRDARGLRRSPGRCGLGGPG